MPTKKIPRLKLIFFNLIFIYFTTRHISSELCFKQIVCGGIWQFLHKERGKLIFTGPKICFSIKLRLFLIYLDEIFPMQSSELQNRRTLHVIRKQKLQQILRYFIFPPANLFS